MYKLQDIIKILNPSEVIGDINKIINKVIDIKDTPSADSILWISSNNYHLISLIKCGVVICHARPENVISSCTYLVCLNPRSSFQKLLKTFFTAIPKTGIESSSKIDSSVILGNDIYIGENVIIEANCKIGDNSFIYHNTIIKENTRIGNNVIIGSFNVIGDTGFGYIKNEFGNYELIPHIGNVIISDNVEIRNNVCIDRAVLGSTIIKENTKIDSYVHVGHNVQVGMNTLLISGTQISGGVTIGDNCWISPSSSFFQKLSIGDDVIVGLGSVVHKNIDNNIMVIGNPARIIGKNN